MGARLAVAFVAIFTTGVAAGSVIEAAAGSPFGRADEDGARWFVERRTGWWDAVTDRVTDLSWTPLLVTVAVVTALLAWRAWRRWQEPLLVLVTVGGEIGVFVAIAGVVDRMRPPVPRLDEVAATASFPSGHTAGGVALYGVLAVLAAAHVDRRGLRRALVAALVVVPVLIGLSRLYRGMHYPSDVVGGALVGGAWLAAVVGVLRATPGRLRVLPEGNTWRGRGRHGHLRTERDR